MGARAEVDEATRAKRAEARRKRMATRENGCVVTTCKGCGASPVRDDGTEVLGEFNWLRTCDVCLYRRCAVCLPERATTCVACEAYLAELEAKEPGSSAAVREEARRVREEGEREVAGEGELELVLGEEAALEEGTGLSWLDDDDGEGAGEGSW